MDYQKVLLLKFHSTDLDRDVTVKEFFVELLTTLFRKKECFSGKRPFGNSGWDYDLAVCFVKNKVIPGSIEDLGDGDFDCDYEYSDFDNAILDLIKNI